MTIDPENGTYSRRRIDQLMDERFRDIEGDVSEPRGEVGRVRKDISALSNRLSYLFGGLAVLSFVLNVLGPALVAILSP